MPYTPDNSPGSLMIGRHRRNVGMVQSGAGHVMHIFRLIVSVLSVVGLRPRLITSSRLGKVVLVIGIIFDLIASLIIRSAHHAINRADLLRKIARNIEIGVGAFELQGSKHEDRHRVVKDFHVRDWKGWLKTG